MESLNSLLFTFMGAAIIFASFGKSGAVRAARCRQNGYYKIHDFFILYIKC
ncbi:MAG: hypothetical protein JWR09_4619 [Mucilaginibacter sp.]|nr:hypothetical protein [Mucilaginibacter sp.]